MAIQKPAGGFQNGGWYWDDAAGAARQYWNGSFNPPGVVGQQSGGGSSSGSSASSSSGGGRMTESEALARGIDVNKLRSQGLLIEAPKNPLQQVNQTIQDSFQKLQNEVIKKFGEYTAGKPFRVDEVLASKKTEAAEQIDPYYDQILGDYLLGVTRKINRGVDDTRDLLTELTTAADKWLTGTKNTLTDAIDQAEQGFADAGTLMSGESLRTEGKMRAGANTAIDDYTGNVANKTKQLQTGLGRAIEDINTDKKSYVSDLERNRFTDVSQRASQLTKEAGQQYVAGFQATLPPELQSASGFDFLKSIGVYS